MNAFAGSEEREEGEIVDDLESISDYSISSPLYSGKSLSPQDLLKDVSLSSISDSGNEDFIDRTQQPTYCGRKYLRKRKTRRHSPDRCSKRRRRSVDYIRFPQKTKCKKESSTDSDSEKLDHRTLRKLKDAMTINRSHEICQNSLRSRLKAMIHPAQTRAEEEDLETLRTLALLSNTKIEEPAVADGQIRIETCDGKEPTQKDENEEKEIEIRKEDNFDDELMQLRLEALKSAMLKKANQRKKLKEKQNMVNSGELNKENNYVNKENLDDDEVNIKNYEVTIKSVDEINIVVNNENVINNEETPKNNFTDIQVLKTKDVALDCNKSVEEDVDIMRAMLLASMSKKITSNPAKLAQKSVFQKVSVNKNLCSLTRHQTVRNLNGANAFKNTQLPTVKPLIINLNNDSDSDTDVLDKMDKTVTNDKDLVNTVTQFLRRQRAAVEAKLNTKPSNVSESSLDKSVVKLLPKSQQREYHLLKQKLLMAKRKRLRRASHKSFENKNIKKLIKNKPENITRSSVIVAEANTSKLANLQKTLEDMQIQKNGRLQMKGKYKELAPLLRKVSQASIERKQCESEIKKLLEELQTARNKLTSSQQNFTNIVKRLQNDKAAIDQRHANLVKLNQVAAINTIKCTSTPIRNNLEETICDISSINEQISITNPLKSNDIQVEPLINPSTSVNESQANNEVSDVKINDDLQRSEAEVKKYVSPLDNKNRDDVVNDPLTTFCPYELFGVCKDPECTFNHCSKS